MIAINFWAVLVATLASFILGWLWYGPLFGKQWMKLRGLDPALMGSMGMPWAPMAGEFILTLITAYVLARFSILLGVVDWVGAVQLALWIWLGFYATTLAGGVLWEKVSKKLYALQAGRWLVSIVVMSVILGVWH